MNRVRAFVRAASWVVPALGLAVLMGVALPPVVHREVGVAAVLQPAPAAAGSVGSARVAPVPPLPPANRPGAGLVRLDVLVGATVHVSPDETLVDAAVLLRDGVIEAVEGTPAPAAEPATPAGAAPAKPEGAAKPDAEAPATPPVVPEALKQRAAGAKVHDARGLHIYAGFIDPFVEVEAPRPDADKPGVHWSLRVMPQRSALDGKGIDEGTAKQLRAQGFAIAGIAPKGGLFRGTGAVVSLAKPDEDPSVTRPPVLVGRAYHSIAFETAGGDGSDGRWGGYPNSQMGAISLVRQTLADANWWRAVQAARAKRPQGSGGAQPGDVHALAALADESVPLLFDVSDELETVRALKLAVEFGRPAVVLTSGMEFRRIEAVKLALGRAGDATQRMGFPPVRSWLIVPLNFPEKPKLASIGEAEAIDLRELMTWEQAPTNLARLHKAEIGRIMLTTSKLRDRGRFLENLRVAVRHGLSERDALAAITTSPASALGLSSAAGRVSPGLLGNLVLADGPLMDKKTKVRDVWIDGLRHEINPAPVRLTGLYSLQLDPAPAKPGVLELLIDKDNGVTVRKTMPAEKPAAEKPAEERPAAEKPADAAPPEPAKASPPKEVTVKAKSVLVSEERISFTIEHDPLGQPGVFTLSGVVIRDATAPTITLTGEGTRADGGRFTWTAVRTGPLPTPAKPDARPDAKADAKADEKADEKDASKAKPDAVAGVWSCSVIGPEPLPAGGMPITLSITRASPPGGSLSGSLTGPMGGGDLRDVRFDEASGALDFTFSPGGGEFTAAFSLKVTGDKLTGVARGPIETTITGTRTSQRASAAGAKDDEDAPVDVPADLPGLPFGAYALKTPPAQERVAFVNATVWTAAEAGIIENGAVIIADGKITYVGSSAGLPRLDSTVHIVDLAGKHITPGLIDCHSHTGISKGVNESGQAVTAEVRIQDVTNPDAINWYRQLAGGITAVNSLHGSANAIGGQNAVNKLRWGSITADDMHFAGAGTYSDVDPFLPGATAQGGAGGRVAPGMKFALGENPKASNAGDRATWRYPQTRMGVEAIIRDRFTAAKRYAEERTAWAAAGANPATAPRRDLELEALAEILAGSRLIHCHSYRQDEIQMLADLCREFGVTIGTYQHNLEGYKVAEHIKRQAIGASLFSDWWAFKVEVQDAIPYAGPIMHEQGVLVSYNSDSDELARRMHVEAAKAHKYSLVPGEGRSVSPHEALKFVTINPAKQLKIDARVGSLEVGKDADLAIWSGSPLSSLTRCEQTWIDGALYFSLERDAALQKQNREHRVRITQKLLRDGKPPAPAKGEGKTPAKPEAKPDSTPPAKPPRGLIAQMAEDAREARREHLLDMLRRGIDPANHRSGQCCDQ